MIVCVRVWERVGYPDKCFFRLIDNFIREKFFFQVAWVIAPRLLRSLSLFPLFPPLSQRVLGVNLTRFLLCFTLPPLSVCFCVLICLRFHFLCVRVSAHPFPCHSFALYPHLPSSSLFICFWLGLIFVVVFCFAFLPNRKKKKATATRTTKTTTRYDFQVCLFTPLWLLLYSLSLGRFLSPFSFARPLPLLLPIASSFSSSAPCVFRCFFALVFVFVFALVAVIAIVLFFCFCFIIVINIIAFLTEADTLSAKRSAY